MAEMYQSHELNENEIRIQIDSYQIDDYQIDEPKVDPKSDKMLTIPYQRQISLILFILGFICPLCFLFNRILFNSTNNLFAYNLSRSSCSLFTFVSLFLLFGLLLRTITVL